MAHYQVVGLLGEDQTDQETPEGPCSDLGLHEGVSQDHPPHITHYSLSKEGRFHTQKLRRRSTSALEW